MNKELEEAIKRLKILECDCIYFENNKCTYNKNKCQREQDIETVLNYIENSISKDKIREVLNHKAKIFFEGNEKFPDISRTIKPTVYINAKDIQELLEVE